MGLFKKKKEKGKNIFSRQIMKKCLPVFLFFLVVLFLAFPGGNIARAGFWEFADSAANKAMRAMQYIPGLSQISSSVNDDLVGVEGYTAKTYGEGNLVLLGMNYLLYGVSFAMSKLLVLSGYLLDEALRAESFSEIIGSEAVSSGWVVVRDFFNITFIMALVFSAFATIFQVEKFHLKKILLTVIIMALLVNFSYPIARFIMDLSNVIMYFFLSESFASFGDTVSPSSMVAKLTNFGELITNIEITSTTDVTAQLIITIIFVFILMITLLVVGVMLFIRIIALAIILILAPIGFIAAIFPSTSKYSSQWWGSLFKYAFFGPIMVFFITMSMKLMIEIGPKASGTGAGGTGLNIGSEQGFLVMGTYFIIPIVFLWTGLTMAQKMGVAGASAVTGKGMQAINWGKRNMLGARQVARWSGVSGGVQKSVDTWKQRGFSGVLGRVPGLGGTQGREDRESLLAGRMTGRQDLIDEVNQRRINAAAGRHDTGNMTSRDLRDLSRTGDNYARAAALNELAERGQATEADLNEMENSFGDTSQAFNQLAERIRSYDPVAFFNNRFADPAERAQRMDTYLSSRDFDVRNLGANSLQNQDFVEALFDSNRISIEDINQIRRNNSAAGNAVRNSIEAIVSGGSRNSVDSEADRNLHLARFAQSGDIHDGAFAEHIAQNLTGEIAANMSDATVRRYSDILAQNIRPNRYREIIMGINNQDVATELNVNIGTIAAPGRNERNIQNVINNDPYLRNLA